MSAEPIPSPNTQIQNHVKVEYGDMPRDAYVIADLLHAYTKRICKVRHIIHKDALYKEELNKFLGKTLFIIVLFFVVTGPISPARSFLFTQKAISNWSKYNNYNFALSVYPILLAITILFFLFTVILPFLGYIKNDISQRIYIYLKKLKPINSLASAILQSEPSLTKGERLLLELRSAEADEAIIEATEFLKLVKWKDIP